MALLKEPVSHQLRFPRFYLHWHTTASFPRIYGEIDVHALLDVVEGRAYPDLFSQRRTRLQRRFLSELRCMAGSRGSGRGQLTFLRVAHGWQCLFADVALGKPGFRDIVKNLRTMPEVFPGLFTACDHAPLEERLAART
ncbi:hypothetical protein [Spirillospora sp. NPDC047279]|uniref:hypothetical protein n=1 Tax=Spirillospora sp. NPDC047279 TaxID=3155478 RepID=UPI0033EB4305